MATKIEWTEETWNPVIGCRRVSEGCERCYAETMAHRLEAMGQERYAGLTVLGKAGRRWTGEARVVREKLGQPLRWRKPRMIFVNSMSDLFHEDVPFDYIAAVFGVMAACPRHTFQILTKRPKRMLKWFRWVEQQSQGAVERYLSSPKMVAAREARRGTVLDEPPPPTREVRHIYDVASSIIGGALTGRLATHGTPECHWRPWPLPNVWLGTSCEDQKGADERIPLLLRCPAAVRWVSAEPLLGPINLHRIERPGYRIPLRGIAALDWVVVGGESGHNARPCALEWVGGIVGDCIDADVPVFVKQLGAYVVSEDRPGADGERWGWRAGLRSRKGGDPEEWPDSLQVRQWPEPPQSEMAHAR